MVEENKPIYRIIDDPEEAEKAKQLLYERIENSIESFETKELTSIDINWYYHPKIKTYKELKLTNINLMSESNCRLFLLSNFNNKVKGKPQLIHQTIQRIPMIRKIEKPVKAKDRDWDGAVKISFKFIDDRYDKRYDGNETDVLAFDFWVYRVEDNGKEYYLLSKEKLSQEYSEFIGMKIDLDDSSDLNSSLKLNKIASIFIVKEHYPYIKILDKEKLIDLSKQLKDKYGWDQQGFSDYVFTHPDGNIYDYTDNFNKLRIAQLLSSKYEGYPLHILKMGPVGTGKTTEAEALHFKFNEDQEILEAGNSTMKSLVPSFKEKPANLGYICKCNRVAVIDELMKMIEKELIVSDNHGDRLATYLGQLNMLLEHKFRTIGSGNDNSTNVKATAKVCITTNNLNRRNSLQQHLGVIDNTTLSRMLIWVQDNAEIERIYSKTRIRKTADTVLSLIPFNPLIPYKDKVSLCRLQDDFLTIYDSCQQFLVIYDLDKLREIFNICTNLTKEPMRQVWRSRGLHHAILILDGLTKYRCLFKDYDSTFTPRKEDYDTTREILINMIQGWDTPLSPSTWKDGFK